MPNRLRPCSRPLKPLQVPIFELTMEMWSRLDHWDPNAFIDLSEEPFNLEYMDGDR